MRLRWESSFEYEWVVRKILILLWFVDDWDVIEVIIFMIWRWWNGWFLTMFGKGWFFKGLTGFWVWDWGENKLSEYLLCIVVSEFYRSRCRSGVVGVRVNCVRIWYNLDGMEVNVWITCETCEWNTSPPWVKNADER